MKKFIMMLFISLAAAFCIKLGTQGRGAEEFGAEDRQPLSTDIKRAAMQKSEVDQSEEYQLCGSGGEEAASAKKVLLSMDSERQEPRAYSFVVKIAKPAALAEGCISLTEAALKERALWLDKLEEVQDRREWFLGYKELLSRQAEMLGTPASIYESFNEQELDRLFRVVQAEIGDEYSFDQKCNVASVIFNRLNHPQFGDTLETVLSPSQFSTMKNGRYLRAQVSQETILACEYSFMIGDTTGGCLFFDSNGVLKYSFVFNDGAHNFYTLQGEAK